MAARNVFTSLLIVLSSLARATSNSEARLQSDPHFGARPEVSGKAKRRVGGNPTLAVDDLCNAVGWDLKGACQFRCAHADLLQLVGENFSGMDRCACHC